MHKEFDLIVIGSGPGGYTAAIRASQLGLKVALIEKGELGGTCLNRGCIPTKALFACAQTLDFIKNAGKFGIKTNPAEIDWQKAQDRKKQVVERQRKGLEYLFKSNKIDVIIGEAEIQKDKTVMVNGEALKCRKIIIASGSDSMQIPSFNINHKNILDSTDFLKLPALPKSMLIVGAGVMGVEFATIMDICGVKTTICEMEQRVFPMEDEEVSKLMERKLKQSGINIVLGQRIERIEDKGDAVEISLADGSKYEAEIASISIGRKLLSDKFSGLGINIAKNQAIEVNDQMETSVKDIYAVGDVTGKNLFAHVAIAQGKIAGETAAGKKSRMDYSTVPAAIIAIPEVGRVGLTEKEALDKGLKIKIGRSSFTASGKAHCIGETEGFVKIIVDKNSHKILGGHIIGPHAADLIQEITFAMRQSLPIENIAQTIHAHPTLCETVLEAAENALRS